MSLPPEITRLHIGQLKDLVRTLLEERQIDTNSIDVGGRRQFINRATREQLLQAITDISEGRYSPRGTLQGGVQLPSSGGARRATTETSTQMSPRRYSEPATSSPARGGAYVPPRRASASETVEIMGKDHPKLKKYFTMKRMGMPMPMIMDKAQSAGVPREMIARLMGEETEMIDVSDDPEARRFAEQITAEREADARATREKEKELQQLRLQQMEEQLRKNAEKPQLDMSELRRQMERRRSSITQPQSPSSSEGSSPKGGASEEKGGTGIYKLQYRRCVKNVAKLKRR